jgi:4-azaleucine resistance transporter AzlC
VLVKYAEVSAAKVSVNSVNMAVTHNGNQFDRKVIIKQAASIGASVAPFGLAFGVACSQANLHWFHALGMSSLVFTGGTQFAAVSVLKDGGTAFAAILAGLLLSSRSLIYGLIMAPKLKGSLWFRALASQLMIDESVAIGSAQESDSAQRFGYLAGGLSVFFFWNITTVLGFFVLGSNAGFTEQYGLDATIPAAFVALVWPRLNDSNQRSIALVGGVLAFVLIPLVPPGMPIVAAALAVPIMLAVRKARGQSSVQSDDGGAP